MPQTPLTWDGVADGAPLKWDSGSWDSFLPDNPNQNQTPKKMQLRVLLGFADASDLALIETAQSVLTDLYTGDGLATYPNPPVTAVNLGLAINAFIAAVGDASNGGPTETAVKDNKRYVLIGLLRQLAGYVQSLHGNDLAKLLFSGFDAASTNTASNPSRLRPSSRSSTATRAN